MAKEMIERIKECMKDPNRIRNVATSSHVHHGKCVSGDTIIFTENFAIFAKDFFEKAKKYGKLVVKDFEKEVYDISFLNIYTFSFFDGMIVKRRIIHAWRLKNSSKMLKIVTESGKEIKVTPEHKFLVLNHNEIQEKPSKNLKVGEKIVVPNILPIKPFSLSKIKTFLLKKICEKEFSINAFNKVFNGKKYLEFLELQNISFEKGYDEIKYVSHKNIGKFSLPKNPQEFKKFFYVFGLLHASKFSLNKKLFVKKQNLLKFLKIVFDSELPLLLFSIPQNLLESFIDGYFEIYKNGFIIEKNENAKFLQLLLLRLGYKSIRRDFDESNSILFIDDIQDALKVFANLQNQIGIEKIIKIEEIENEKFVYDFTVEETHNFVANGFFIHNTTLTDNLMAGAGMLAEEMAGKVMYTWFDEQERKRELTIYGACVSMVHEYRGKDYLINLVDTPGHVDFGGDVTRAMRAVDGTIVLVCAVEGIMPQTETVFRQALREYVKPVLFINKVDRLIKELKLTPQQMMERFEKTIKDVNLLIEKYAPPEFKNQWKVSVQNGTVAFGSAKKRWAISLPFMQETGITFKDIINMTLNDEEEELAKKAPLHKVVLDMIIKHLPSPVEAQKYRVPKIWLGDINSEIGKQMLNCDSNGHLAAIVTKMVPDPHVGFVATARIFSGKVYKGKDVYLVLNKKRKKLQQVAIYKGIQRISVEEVTAGNIVAIVGIPEAFTGETICDADYIIEPFSEIKHLFEPVVTKAVEPKNPMELSKLVDALNKIAKEDAVLKVKINPETGEYLVCGLGELHLEAKVENKLKEMGIDIIMSDPIVVYRETILGKTPQPVEAKSPNKHNRFYIIVEPLEEGVYKALMKGEIKDNVVLKKRNEEIIKALINAGMPREEAKNVKVIYNKNVFIDLTKGVQFLNEVIEMIFNAFKDVMEDGPLAREPCMKIKVKLVDAELHEDPVHRGPGQIMPAVRWGIRQAMLLAKPALLEPKQIIRVDVPQELMGNVIREIQNRRGQILNIQEESGATIIIAKLPVAESFGFDASLKSATSGRGFYSLIDIVFEKVPDELFESTVKSIRKRKGLSEEIPKPS